MYAIFVFKICILAANIIITVKINGKIASSFDNSMCNFIFLNAIPI